jgi:hypothetical protein
MVEGIVDLFEAIEVDHHESQPRLLATGQGHDLPNAFVEQDRVRQPGQQVVNRLLSQRLLRPLALGDITGDARIANHRTGLIERRNTNPDLDDRAIISPHESSRLRGGSPRRIPSNASRTSSPNSPGINVALSAWLIISSRV